MNEEAKTRKWFVRASKEEEERLLGKLYISSKIISTGRHARCPLYYCVGWTVNNRHIRVLSGHL
jgi:hypothetical protein